MNIAIVPQAKPLRTILKLSLFSVFLLVPQYIFGQAATGSSASLTCWDSHHANFQTRRVKTAVAKSSRGSAYAEVVAEASTDAVGAEFCKNKAELFFASDGSNYEVAYEKAGLEDQGVGLRVVGWSRNGTRLLAELSVWGYDRDTEVTKSVLLLDSATGQVKELPLDDAFERVFGKDCEFDSSLVGWQNDDNVLVRVSKTPATSRYEQTFCVEKPTVYSFSLKDGRMQRGGR